MQGRIGALVVALTGAQLARSSRRVVQALARRPLLFVAAARLATVARMADEADGIRADPDVVTNAESALVASFSADVGAELAVVDGATALLLHVLLTVGPRRAKLSRDEAGALVAAGNSREVILLVNTYLGVRAFRVIRAARAVLSHGLENEALAHDRILVELNAHRRAILDDETGREALAWLLRERTRGVKKRVAEMGDDDLWSDLSANAHGDPLPVLHLRAGDALDLSPRRTPATRASLLMYAGFARDQAALIAHLAETTIRGLEELDAAIQAGWERLSAEEDSATVDD